MRAPACSSTRWPAMLLVSSPRTRRTDTAAGRHVRRRHRDAGHLAGVGHLGRRERRQAHDGAQRGRGRGSPTVRTLIRPPRFSRRTTCRTARRGRSPCRTTGTCPGGSAATAATGAAGAGGRRAADARRGSRSISAR
ncbi:MAG: hypothetical protein MZV64_73335 [Ignavibacteriales bacterium]|nr:hypothetical protein [Ignavibacteriales bacterium]